MTEWGVELTSHRLALEQVVVALTALAGTCLEPYAGSAAAPVGWVLREAAELTLDDGPQTWGGPAH